MADLQVVVDPQHVGQPSRTDDCFRVLIDIIPSLGAKKASKADETDSPNSKKSEGGDDEEKKDDVDSNATDGRK